MEIEEAKKTIRAFHQSIEDLRPDAIVQSSKDLPTTSARIKHAHFVYIEELIEHGGLTEDILQEMMESFGIIDSFFCETPDPINTKYRDYLNGLKNGEVTDFLLPNPFGEIDAVVEIHNFIGECWFKKHRTDLFTDNPLGTFIYSELRKKATKEKDIKLLKSIVNTAKTRKVDFPNKKDNTESIFI